MDKHPITINIGPQDKSSWFCIAVAITIVGGLIAMGSCTARESEAMYHSRTVEAAHGRVAP